MFQGCIAVNKSDRLNYAGDHCRYATDVTDCQSAPAIRTFLSPAAASHLSGVSTESTLLFSGVILITVLNDVDGGETAPQSPSRHSSNQPAIWW